MGTLTVRENLAFSANLRLSRKEYSSADKEMRVDSVIQELGLKDCADTKVGTSAFRGVLNSCWDWACEWTGSSSRVLHSHKNYFQNNNSRVERCISTYLVTVGMCHFTLTGLDMTLFSLRLGPCFCVVFLAERRRGAASGWSSSRLPPSCSWMSPQQAWTPTLPTPSWNCCKSTTPALLSNIPTSCEQVNNTVCRFFF